MLLHKFIDVHLKSIDGQLKLVQCENKSQGVDLKVEDTETAPRIGSADNTANDEQAPNDLNNFENWKNKQPIK